MTEHDLSDTEVIAIQARRLAQLQLENNAMQRAILKVLESPVDVYKLDFTTEQIIEIRRMIEPLTRFTGQG